MMKTWMKYLGPPVVAMLLALPLMAETVDVVPGVIGSPADFDTGTVNATVNAGGTVEFWVEFDPLGIAADPSTPPFEYTANFQWTTPSPGAMLSVEGVSAMDNSFLNFADAGIDTAVASSDTSIETGFAFPAFPFDVYGYHATIEGLAPGDTVVFQKVGTGGVVVPEPTSILIVFMTIVALDVRRRLATA